MGKVLISFALCLLIFLHPWDTYGQTKTNKTLSKSREQTEVPVHEPSDLSIDLGQKGNNVEDNKNNFKIKSEKNKSKYHKTSHYEGKRPIKDSKFKATGTAFGVTEQRSFGTPGSTAISPLSEYLEENKIENIYQRSIQQGVKETRRGEKLRPEEKEMKLPKKQH